MSVEGMQVTVVANGLIEALKKDGVNLDDRLGKNASNYVREIVAHLSQPQPVAQGEAVGWVAWHPEHGYGLPHGPVELCRSPAEPYCDDGWRPVPLYATPTIPTGHRVVPEPHTNDNYEQDEDGGIDVYSDGHKDGWNSCREAMLAAAPDAGGV